MSIIKRYCCVAALCIVLILTGFMILNGALLRKEAQLLSTLKDRHIQTHTLHLPLLGLVQVKAFTPPVETAANVPVYHVFRFISLVKNLLTLGELVAQPVEHVTYLNLLKAFCLQLTCGVLVAVVVICSIGKLVRRVKRATAPPAQVARDVVAKKIQKQIKADRPAKVPPEVVSMEMKAPTPVQVVSLEKTKAVTPAQVVSLEDTKAVTPAQVAKDGVAKKKKKKKKQPKVDRPAQVATEVVSMETKADLPTQVVKDGVAKKKKQPKVDRPAQVATEAVSMETKADLPTQVVKDGVAKKKKQPKVDRPAQVATEAVSMETKADLPAQVVKDGVAKKKQPKVDRPAQVATEAVSMETKADLPAQVVKDGVAKKKKQPKVDRPAQVATEAVSMETKADLPAQVVKDGVAKKKKQPKVDRPAQVATEAVSMETKADLPTQVVKDGVAKKKKQPKVDRPAQVAKDGVAKKKKQPKVDRPAQVSTEVVSMKTKADLPTQVVKDGVAKKKKQPKVDRPAQVAKDGVAKKEKQPKVDRPAQVATEAVSMEKTDPPADEFGWQVASRRRKQKPAQPGQVSRGEGAKNGKKAAQPTWVVVRKAAPQPRVVRQTVATEERKAAPPPAQVPSGRLATISLPPAHPSYAYKAMSGAANNQTPQLLHEVWKPAPKKMKTKKAATLPNAPPHVQNGKRWTEWLEVPLQQQHHLRSHVPSIQREFNVSITFPSNKYIVIIGDREMVTLACFKIQRLVDLSKVTNVDLVSLFYKVNHRDRPSRLWSSGHVLSRVSVDPSMYGKIIGQAGGTVNAIRKQYGVEIYIPHINEEYKAIDVLGQQRDVQRAVDHIHQLVRPRSYRRSSDILYSNAERPTYIPGLNLRPKSNRTP
ncbi:uncharacterized protein [Panulirus ornatus]|uniref:uncharacterized protein n=1 Tax=Panulirus ornatus TaxID=150431 RepID=UPI003A8BE35F